MGGRGALDPEGLGTLLNTIDITPVGARKAAETAMAPGSQNSSQRNYYVVDRGVAGEGDGDWPLRWLAKSFENTLCFGDRLAPGRLHRHHVARSVSPCSVTHECCE